MASTGDVPTADPVKGSAVAMWGSEASTLADRHQLFATLLERNGVPPDWRRPASFDTLVRLVLEQQVSLASANAAFARLRERVGEVTPESILDSSEAELRADGFSRQKSGYVRGIAGQIAAGDLDLADLRPDDPGTVSRLLAVRGIGPWTVACYRLFVLGDLDVWPSGDRALYVSLGRNLGLGDVPGGEEADTIARAWSPHRSTAARMLWHDYLGGRSHVPDERAGFL